MMAHLNKVVVSVFNQETGAPLRGYDHQKLSRKTCRCWGDCLCIGTEYGCRETVYLPFNTEYGFKFKFQDGARRRIRITIDGTEVVSNLIVQDGSSLERFQNTNKAFKFVNLDNPAVQDPTSEDNGSIKIELWKERAPEYLPYTRLSYTKSAPRSSGGTLRAMSMSSTADSYGFSSSSVSNERGMDFQNLSLDCSYSDRGATVEGKTSSQKFSSTTWAGDEGLAEVFVFDLRANQVIQSNTDPLQGLGDEFMLALAKTPYPKMIYIRPEFMSVLAHLPAGLFERNTERETLQLGLTGWVKGTPVHQNRDLGPSWKIV